MNNQVDALNPHDRHRRSGGDARAIQSGRSPHLVTRLDLPGSRRGYLLDHDSGSASQGVNVGLLYPVYPEPLRGQSFCGQHEDQRYCQEARDLPSDPAPSPARSAAARALLQPGDEELRGEHLGNRAGTATKTHPAQ
jgi:hypothetical protein